VADGHAVSRDDAMFQLVKQTQDMRLYRWRSLVVNFHWNEFQAQQFRDIGTICRQVVEEHCQMSSIVVMRGDISLNLDAETRGEGAALTKEFELTNTGQALVMEADGFKASLARSLITGVNLLARSKARQRVFKDPREATEWVCTIEEQPPEILDARERVWVELERLFADLPA
jgi:hypothetical protein